MFRAAPGASVVRLETVMIEAVLPEHGFVGKLELKGDPDQKTCNSLKFTPPLYLGRVHKQI